MTWGDCLGGHESDGPPTAYELDHDNDDRDDSIGRPEAALSAQKKIHPVLVYAKNFAADLFLQEPEFA